MRQPLPIAGDALRYLVAGGINTLVTLALYEVLVGVIGSTLAYTCVWVLGIAFVSYVYPKFVFKTVIGPLTRGTVAINAVMTFLIGLAANYTVAEVLQYPRLSIFVSLGVTTVYGFISNRALVRRRR